MSKLATFLRHTMAALLAAIGGLSNPEKMPGFSWSTPASKCRTGSKLRHILGSVCSGCYAADDANWNPSRYGCDNVKAATSRRFAILTEALRDPVAAEAFVYSFAALLNRKLATWKKRESEGKPNANDARFFRWHDSGDIQSVEHLRLIVWIAELCPEIHFWLPTREYGIERNYRGKCKSPYPSNLTVRLSAHIIGEAGPVAATKGIPGLSTSAVNVAKTNRIAGYSECPAWRTRKDGSMVTEAEALAMHAERRAGSLGYCGGCRRCWDDAEHVSYPLHANKPIPLPEGFDV